MQSSHVHIIWLRAAEPHILFHSPSLKKRTDYDTIFVNKGNEVSAMLMREKLIKRFLWGISILNSYIAFNSQLNYHDINILSENFMRDMLNILYSYRLINPKERNNPAFDLISREERLLIQVTSSATPEKIKSALIELGKVISHRHNLLKHLQDLDKLYAALKKDGSAKAEQNCTPMDKDKLAEVEQKRASLKKQIAQMPDLTGYTMKFVILTRDANKQKKYQGAHKTGYNHPDDIFFDAEQDILDLSDFIRAVNDLDDRRLQELDVFMKRHANLFIRRPVPPEPKDNIDAVIDEYANNFESPLFRHTYVSDTKVQLHNLFVDPAYCVPGEEPSRDIVSLFSQFLWQDNSLRMLYIDGDAAIGKTSLISWLCYHYRNISKEDSTDSIGKAIFMGSKLICVRLRELNFVNKSKDSICPILSYLGIKSSADFQQNYSNAVIIFDGIDEISMIDNSISSAFIARFLLTVRRHFKGNKLIITGRPHFFDVNSLRAEAFKIKHIILQHFDREMRKEWIEKYELCGEVVPHKTKQYILSLDDPAAEGVADTPLALYLLTACEVREEIQGNRWALYHEIFRNAIMKTEYNENFSVGTAHPAYQNLDVIYDIVCRISFKMFQNSKEERYYISSLELDQIIQNTEMRGVPREWVRQCCVLCAYWKIGSNAGALEFYHNDIRDFFFCEYLYDILASCARVPEGIASTMFIKSLCAIFQYGYISGTTWAQAFEFLYLRLKYESETAYSGAPDFLSTGAGFSKLFMKFFTNQELYGFPFDGAPYTSIRQVLFNGVLLIRLIYQIWVDKDPEHNRLSFWENEGDYNLLVSSNVFLDWHDMFQQTIQIASDSIISIGSSIEMSYLKLCHIPFDRAIFSRSLLQNASLAGSNLQKASFVNAVLKDTDFCGCDLRDASFRSATLINVNFTGAKLSQTDFSFAKIQDCPWGNTTFSKCDFTHAEFHHCILTNTQYPQSKLEATSFFDSPLDYAAFGKDVYLGQITFSGCSLGKANFNGAVLGRIRFLDCDLTASCFYDARLDHVTFCGGTLKHIDFEQAAFAATDLTPLDVSCSLSHTKFLASECPQLPNVSSAF